MNARARAFGLAALLALATLGEGGAAAELLLAWHVVLALLLAWELRAVGADHGPTLLAALAAVAAVAWASASAILVAPYAYAAWLAVLELLACLGVGWLAARGGLALSRTLVAPLAAVAALHAVYFLVEKFAVGAFRPASTFLNPNHLAAWLVAVLALTAGTAIESRPRGRRAVLFATAAALVSCVVVLSGSRGALLGAVVAASVLFLTMRSRLSRSWRRALLAATVIVALVAAGGIALRYRTSDPFRYQRVQIWSATVDVSAAHPWLGTGPRQFAAAARTIQFPDGDGPLRHDRGFSSTHSDWLRVPAEWGWPGAVFMLALGAAIVLGVRRAQRDGESAAGPTAALAALVVQGAVENLSQRPAVYLLAAVLAGVLVAIPRRGEVRAPAAGRWVLLPLALLLVVGDVAPYLAHVAVRGLPRGGLNDVQAARLDAAIELNPLHPDYRARVAEAILAAPGGLTHAADYLRARGAVEDAIRLHPASARYRRLLGRVEGEACASLFRDVATRERAREAFSAAARLAPFDPFLPLEEAGMLLRTGDALGATRAARRALAIEPESVVPRLVLAVALYEAAGVEARDEARRLIAEAHEKGVRWAEWADTSDYARGLFVPDASLLRQIAARAEREEIRTNASGPG